MTTQWPSENPWAINFDGIKPLEQHLTSEQQKELRDAYVLAIHEDTANRLDVLQSHISAATKQSLDQSIPNWKTDVFKNVPAASVSTSKENQWWWDRTKEAVGGAVDSVTDTIGGWAHKAGNLFQQWVDKVPVVATAKAAVDNQQENFSRMKQLFSDPVNFFKELGDALKDIFTKFDFTKIKEFFFPSSVLSDIRLGIEKASTLLDLGSDAQSWKELLMDCREFRDIKISDLRTAKDSTNPKETLHIDADNRDIKTFFDTFFKEENFAKMIPTIIGKGKTLQDIEDMTIADFLKNLA